MILITLVKGTCMFYLRILSKPSCGQERRVLSLIDYKYLHLIHLSVLYYHILAFHINYFLYIKLPFILFVNEIFLIVLFVHFFFISINLIYNYHLLINNIYFLRKKYQTKKNSYNTHHKPRTLIKIRTFIFKIYHCKAINKFNEVK